MESDDVVVARSASGQLSPRSRRNPALWAGSSTIASTTRSQPASPPASVPTLILAGSPPSTLAASPCAVSSAFHAETSLRASSRTSDSAEAQAARPQAMVPLPATAGEV
jgi:hypothetical protein